MPHPLAWVSVTPLNFITGAIEKKDVKYNNWKDKKRPHPMLHGLVVIIARLIGGQRDKKIACTIHDAYYICNNTVGRIGVIDNSLAFIVFIISIILVPGCEE